MKLGSAARTTQGGHGATSGGSAYATPGRMESSAGVARMQRAHDALRANIDRTQTARGMVRGDASGSSIQFMPGPASSRGSGHGRYTGDFQRGVTRGAESGHGTGRGYGWGSGMPWDDEEDSHALPGYMNVAGITDEERNVMKSPKAKARAAFITWLRENFPQQYQRAMRKAHEGPPGMGDENGGGFNWQKFIDAAAATAQAVFTGKAQRDMLSINIERAKAGLPPVDTSFAAPVVRTQIDVSPEIAERLERQAQAGMGTIALVAGAALLGLFLITR
jgi:hypothetical protein